MSDWQTENSRRCFEEAIRLIGEKCEKNRKPGETMEETIKRLGLDKGYFAR